MIKKYLKKYLKKKGRKLSMTWDYCNSIIIECQYTKSCVEINYDSSGT